MSPLHITSVEILPSYFQESEHFLQLLESLPLLPENPIVVTVDITSLYTCIPHEEDIESVLHCMKLHADTLPPSAPSPHTIGILFKTILKNNSVSFMGRHSHQLVSTTLGTKAAPPFANLFMNCYKETILLEEIHRRHLLDLPGHYQTAPIHQGFHEQPPPNN